MKIYRHGKTTNRHLHNVVLARRRLPSTKTGSREYLRLVRAEVVAKHYAKPEED